MTSRFLQIHTLTTYAASLLNRDDVGAAKRLPFGGSMRTRISSQCLKRHWRKAAGAWSLEALGVPMTVRSRRIFPERIAAPLLAEGHAVPPVIAVVQALMDVVLQKNEKGDAAADKPSRKKVGTVTTEDALKTLETGQVIVLGQPEIDFLLAAARAILAEGTADPKAAAMAYVKQNRANLEALRTAAGLDGALFGRMVTSDIFARGDAAIHVAHAFTVHAAESEPDYFTAVDDLVQAAGETGSGLISTTELTSGLFYGYVVIDLPKLIENLSDDASLAGQVTERLLHLIASVSPGAKLGSTAPYAYAEAVLVEAGARQPRTLANAFRQALPEAASLGETALDRLGEYLRRFDTMYGPDEDRRVAALTMPAAFPAEPMPLAPLATWAGGIVAGTP
ncbi:Type I-E CRISPR-associated protein Cas7/Cse4/CasC [Rhodovastum atsumiense]|uniref:Type I-E CRISPR-associated protein Cas7/Cse4/CasC n=1 Tax=Rhodovastum atsumiense TaxID=504468 RepID=A0A5M6INI8_9PROT|nr:type I-E CRISPR-associated protein Cas7/Cse4/CasC [Rhodovastum atsumiense]KAA5609833.1 type I-E CRISPR-associated protein Cas7/Cse4/CasC [Rhodovastum atsumiense]CAH2603746.1 Type I-E CRISPR-associated protein Cas7/Cse4/CasC [Rhodovastum atsumiense]